MTRRPLRGTAAAAVTAVVLAILAPATAAAAQAQPVSSAATISPGAVMVSPVEGDATSTCTASFVFSGGGTTYLGYAAHCASAGGTMGLSGCESDPLPVGTPISIQRSDGSQAQGRLAYSSWTAMQQHGETDRAVCLHNDFALVALDEADTDNVDPSVPAVGGPTGLDTDGTAPGEPVYSYQPVGDGPAVKEGASLGTRGGGMAHRVDITPPGVPGDSGSGFVDSDGDAFGVLSTQYLDERGTNGVTDIAFALGYASRYGDVGQVSLVQGTEPFTPPLE